jgi:hypothetical protein
MKKIVSLLTVITIILTMLTFGAVNASAASSSLKFSSSSVEVGSKVTVTVTLQNGSEMLDASCKITYNESVLRCDSKGAADGGAGVLTFVSDKSASKYTISLTFTAVKVGQSNIQVKDCIYTYQGSNGLSTEQSFAGQSATISVKDKVLSSNANLKSLSLNTGSISPKFSANTTSYTAKVSNTVTKVNVTARTADSGAKVVSVAGNTNLKVGENNVVVTVQAANGTQKKYTIAVTRLAEGELTEQEQQQQAADEIKQKLETTIDEKPYSVVTDISGASLFKGFTATTVKYNDIDVQVAVDENNEFSLYYLKSAESEELLPYTYNEEEKAFERLKYLSIADNLYIFSNFPKEFKAQDGLFASNLNISDFNVECFSSNDDKYSDFYYVYCYSGGKYNVYRYDALEGTMQRFPEFEKSDEVVVEPEQKENILTKFASLSTNSKIIVLSLIVALLGAIVLIVFLVIFVIKKIAKKDENIIFESINDFDEITEENDISSTTED